MTDASIKKYERIYYEIMDLTPEKTLQIVLEAKSEDVKNFYELIGDFLLQKKQKEII